MKQKIYIANSKDREEAIRILAINGYTVRIVSEKINNKKTYFIEYWRE